MNVSRRGHGCVSSSFLSNRFPTGQTSGKEAVSYYWHNEIQKASAFLAGRWAQRAYATAGKIMQSIRLPVESH